MIKTWINGINGRMGQTLQERIIESNEFTLCGGSSLNYMGTFTNDGPLVETSDKAVIHRASLIIDFSSPEGNCELARLIKDTNTSKSKIIIATTGLSEDEYNSWRQIAEEKDLSVLMAPNTSLGVLVQMHVSKIMAKVLSPHDFDIEIFESHHRYKKDSPSGTAKFLAEGIAHQEGLQLNFGRQGPRGEKELGVSASRGGSVFGEHSIRFMGLNEELEITHKALSRRLFADGALVLGNWLNKQPGGFYELKDVDLTKLNY